MTPIEAAFQSVAPRAPGVTFAQFAERVRSCDVYPVEVDGKTAGAIVVDGPDIHACVLPWAKGRWMSRAALRVLDGVISACGFARTKATTAEGEHFVIRLGFERRGEWFVKDCTYGH
jgi:hypothetical protein